ncbi:hypothetical protein BURKHO8Y_210172 [Burkholderia sp. 8Y]|nr:hypothetical protein BURKHO8Y_210172 [Burkholderia sp. 8Y]
MGHPGIPIELCENYRFLAVSPLSHHATVDGFGPRLILFSGSIHDRHFRSSRKL